jgi:hypothetical protein
MILVKRAIFFVIFFIVFWVIDTIPVNAAGGSYGWTYGWTRIGGSAGEEFGGQSVAVDTNGNIFITGGFSYTVNFDGTGGSDEHTANDDEADVFITKYNANGSYGWTRHFGGIAEDYGDGIAVDSDGNVFVTGYFQGTADFDDTGGTDNHAAVWGGDIFITKYNADGSYGWTRTMGNTGDQLGYAIAVDGNDDVIAMGYFNGTVDFDGTSGTDNHASADGTTFITKYHNDGSYSWTRNFGSSWQQWDYDITTDADNYIYATSFFGGTSDFDGSDGVDIHTSNGAYDMFVTRLSADGTYKWTKTIGGTGDDRGSGIATDANGFVYVTGSYSDTVNFNTSGGSDNRTASGGKDTFVLKLKESGKYIWTKTYGGDTIYDWGSDVATDTSGNLFISGTFGGTTDFDVGDGTDNYTAGPGMDSFITKYNADGTYGWTRPLHSTNTVNDAAEAFALTVNEHNVYVTGFFIGTVDFDGSAGTDLVSSDPGNFDFFLVNYTDDVPEISNVAAVVSDDSGQINWTTDDSSSSQVDYGLTDDYGNSTAETDTGGGVNDHSADVPITHACANYYYRVKSTDSDGNKAISDNRSFNASGCLASSIINGISEEIVATGGSLDLVNGQSEATLLVPDGAAPTDAAYQINVLDPAGVPEMPSGTRLARGNFYNLLAVANNDSEIDNFAEPVVFSIAYGPDVETGFNEGSLDIYKYDGSRWIKQNCTLNTNTNTITCMLGSFSVYAMFGQENSSGSGTSSPSAPTCGDSPPLTIPDLFQINTQGRQATLYFTPAIRNSGYYISYSTKPIAEEHGVYVNLGNEGVQKFTVDLLAPNKSYYFKVRGQNGCMPGKWSDVMKITTLGKYSKMTAVYYKYGLIKKRIYAGKL